MAIPVAILYSLFFPALSYAEIFVKVKLHATPQAAHCDLEVVATNTGSRPVELVFNTAQRFDFYAKDKHDRIVWQWSHERVFANDQTTLTLKPGEYLQRKAQWAYDRNGGGHVPAGSYRMMGAITAQPQDRYSTPVAVCVPAPSAAR